MTALVTIDKVKTGLRIDGSDSDDLLTMLINTASEAVINYLKAQASVVIDMDALADSPSDYEPPSTVQWATIAQVGYWFDGYDGAPLDPGNLCTAARDLLYPLRDPALA
jgi:hypothetical protein